MSEDQKLDSWLAPLEVSRQKLGVVTKRLADAYTQLALESDDQFLATPVTKLPTGEERGEFLAIDLGGSNLRVAFVNLLGPSRVPGRRFSLSTYDERIEKYGQKSWPIAENLKNEKAEDLFAWIGDCLAEVIRDHFKNAQPDKIPAEVPLGITFSFPMMQSTLSEATLLPMGKGFSITSNPDLGSLVMKGYERHTKPVTNANGQIEKALPPVKLTAIANDSATTLISLVYTTQQKPGSKAVIGLILGTGCNAAVPMKPSSLSSKKVEYATKGSTVDEIVVNTEWTIRGVREALAGADMFTKWDEALDKALPTPGFQPFEYMTAGSYLGEIVRLAVVDYFVHALDLKESDLPPRLTQRNGLTTTYLCWNVVTTDSPSSLAATLNASSEFGNNPSFTWTPSHANVLLRTERAVLRRSQALISAAITALLISSGELSLTSPTQISSPSSISPSTISPPHPSASNGSTPADDPPQHPTTPSHASPKPPLPNAELVVAYCGGLICQYRGYVERVHADLGALRADIIAEKGTAVVLREASEGGVIGAGVLAATVWEGN